MSAHLSPRVFARLGIGVLAVLGIILAADLLATSGKSARGAVIAGLAAGNLGPARTQAVVDELSARAARPVAIRTPSGTVTPTADELGLTFDADATTARLMAQPRNPFARLAALFGRSHTIDPVVRLDRSALRTALDDHRGVLEKAAVEGGVHYREGAPIGDFPAAGKRVARTAAEVTLSRHWLDGRTVDLPTEDFAPTVSADTVRATVEGPAAQAVAAPLVVRGADNATIRITPTQLGTVLHFVPDGRGGLRLQVDEKPAVALLRPGLARTEHAPRNATFSLSSGTPTVVASRDGARIDWPRTFDAMITAAAADDAPRRTADVAYRITKPRLDTAAARKLGVREVVSEFGTGGFSAASGENIRVVAGEVDGALVLPGKTFSLNGYTGPRGTAQGYVTSTIIDHGHAAKAVGGGISQFATTLYNAAYFAGLEDVDHTEHSYYISRYPEAREATVFEGAIDLVFRNNTRYGIYIETAWSESAVTVRMWSTTTVDVESITGDRYAYTDPETMKLPAGDGCIASSGSRGFTTSNTRVITDARTGNEIGRHTRTVKYDPEPIVTCG
ncbi:VanW family protein [Gordonia sp. NPDC003424]